MVGKAGSHASPCSSTARSLLIANEGPLAASAADTAVVSRGALEGDALGLDWPDSGSNDEEGQEEEEEDEFSFPTECERE
jgi:hypothetical protein